MSYPRVYLKNLWIIIVEPTVGISSCKRKVASKKLPLTRNRRSALSVPTVIRVLVSQIQIIQYTPTTAVTRTGLTPVLSTGGCSLINNNSNSHHGKNSSHCYYNLLFFLDCIQILDRKSAFLNLLRAMSGVTVPRENRCKSYHEFDAISA
jgi:hypothetical protein